MRNVWRGEKENQREKTHTRKKTGTKVHWIKTNDYREMRRLNNFFVNISSEQHLEKFNATCTIEWFLSFLSRVQFSTLTTDETNEVCRIVNNLIHRHCMKFNVMKIVNYQAYMTSRAMLINNNEYIEFVGTLSIVVLYLLMNRVVVYSIYLSRIFHGY
jgi:hypothetical protein